MLAPLTSLVNDFIDTPLMAAGRFIAAPAVVESDRVWSWGQIHQAAIEFMPRIARAGSVCNLCQSRAPFIVTWLAALRNGQRLILPPSGGNAELFAMLRSNPRSVIVTDDDSGVLPGWRELATCVHCSPGFPAGRVALADLAWQPPWDQSLITLYTSGTTGEPEPHAKSLRQLANGARALAERLSTEIAAEWNAIRNVVCSVAPQHMFGVEASVMLPLVHGLAVLDRRPLLPAEVEDAFAASDPSVWIATPLHLHSVVRADTALAHCCAVIVSTMPLAQVVAQQAEALLQAPVLEIYGSTETGALAMRRSARESDWRPLGDVEITAADAGARASGSHFASPAVLPDQIEATSSGRFRLRGRVADLVKIAGRRASLAGLNLVLQELPGLEDGVLFMPTSEDPTQRMCLVHSGPPLDRSATEQWLRARIDPVFLPRTIIRVERLPRGDNGKLRRQSLDEIHASWLGSGANAQRLALSPVSSHSVSPRFEFRIAGNHPAFAGHFPGHPIVPGVVILDHVLSGMNPAPNRLRVVLEQVTFSDALLPGETAHVTCAARPGQSSFRVSTRRGGAEVSIAAGRVRFEEPGDDEGACGTA